MGDTRHDADELQLPVLGLYADMELGCGSVLLPDEFLALPSLTRLSIIGQWQIALAHHRSAAWQQLQQDVSNARPDLDAAERHALLRTACEAAGVEVASGADGNPTPS